MDNNFNQPNNQDNQNNGGNPFGNFVNNVNYNMGTVNQKPNIIFGSLGALAAAVVGAILWIIVTWTTGYIFGILGMGIVWLAMFLYEKLAKGINLLGVIICIVLTFIAIWVGNRVGQVLVLQSELQSQSPALYGNISYSDTNTLFKLARELDEEVNAAYWHDLLLSYGLTIVCSVALIAAKIKRRK